MIRSWTFQKKVTAGFGVMVGMTALTAVVAVYALHAVVASKDRVVTIHAVNLTNAATLQAASNNWVAEFRGFLLLMEDRFLDQRRQAEKDFSETMRRLEQDAYGIRLAG